jgi:plastocyanin
VRLPVFLVALAAAALVTELVSASGQPVVVTQKNRAFAPSAVTIERGGTLRFTNEDDYLHQVYVSGPRFRFDSSEQSPGQLVDVSFPQSGQFDVICGIHPKMRLQVDVK